MLQEIYINNFVLIDKLRVELGDGLNVLTGETGAGKSIIIDALGLIIGERIRNDYIRDESRKAVVEAVFDVSDSQEAYSFLQENELMDEGENLVIITREISPNGRSSARINGRSVTVTFLKTLAVCLLDMHLQHQHLSVLRAEMFLHYVDGFSEGCDKILPRIKVMYAEISSKRREMEELQQNEQAKLQRLDFLNYQIDEIEKANLVTGEEEELIVLARRIRNSRLLLENSSKILTLLYEGREGCNAFDLIAKAIDITGESEEEEFFVGLRDQLEEIYYVLQDKASEISTYRDGLDFNPGMQEEVEERLYLINRLKAKYGGSIEEILTYLSNARQEKIMLEGSHDRKQALQQELEGLKNDYYGLCKKLSQKRIGGAKILENRVNQELFELNMPHIQFAVLVEPSGNETAYGLDKVEFMFSANPGEEMRPISRVASGGEISRFVLALKKALAEVYAVPTLIFDEIDVGVGGTSLASMALKLREIADSHQVILVTHSPQVASYANCHYLIEKKIKANKTSTIVNKLDDKQRIREIARMLAGDNYSDITLEHAREMYAQARKSQT